MGLDIYLMKKRHVSYDGGKTLVESNEQVYWANITHNLNKMADSAGIYEALWRPEEIDAIQASDITPILEKGLAHMKSNPAQYITLNPENGWGSYEGFIPWIENYIAACKENPDALIEISR